VFRIIIGAAKVEWNRAARSTQTLDSYHSSEELQMQKLRYVWMIVVTTGGLTGILTCAARSVVPTNEQPAKALELKASSDVMFAVERAEFTNVAPDKLLVTVGDTLYMLDSQRHILWKQTVGDVVGQPFAMADGTIHVLIVQDYVHLVISAATGKTLTCIDCNTTARTTFTQMLPFNQNQYLAVETNAYFRQNKSTKNTPDEVALWQGDKVLWTAPIPPDAEIRVVGDKILAIEKKEQAVVIHEVVPAKIITPKP
jgi:hypothetical protein